MSVRNGQLKTNSATVHQHHPNPFDGRGSSGKLRSSGDTHGDGPLYLHTLEPVSQL